MVLIEKNKVMQHNEVTTTKQKLVLHHKYFERLSTQDGGDEGQQ